MNIEDRIEELRKDPEFLPLGVAIRLEKEGYCPEAIVQAVNAAFRSNLAYDDGLFATKVENGNST